MKDVRQLGSPEPGYFILRLVRGGPYVPAEIRLDPGYDPTTGAPMDRPARLRAFIGGEPQTDETIDMIWEFGRRCTATDHDYLVAVAEWARVHAPHLPEANPREAVNLRRVPPPF